MLRHRGLLHCSNVATNRKVQVNELLVGVHTSVFFFFSSVRGEALNYTTTTAEVLAVRKE